MRPGRLRVSQQEDRFGPRYETRCDERSNTMAISDARRGFLPGHVQASGRQRRGMHNTSSPQRTASRRGNETSSVVVPLCHRIGRRRARSSASRHASPALSRQSASTWSSRTTTPASSTCDFSAVDVVAFASHKALSCDTHNLGPNASELRVHAPRKPPQTCALCRLFSCCFPLPLPARHRSPASTAFGWRIDTKPSKPPACRPTRPENLRRRLQVFRHSPSAAAANSLNGFLCEP